ncbi:hypothetical protein TTHERM_000533949 (macronuclear) [Tetrahymena thermophila SB210]|uniref:Uncharacterized protein n=1 Tax=Tetrahymena thermophila (strain SB210) TaxID=312017 RepID=W7WYI2_TETTS|nr:hypothetical protein TTHERM_000533949 [Tetrahymena thermophila SB210]EWS71925.1 hypothetical protein TTHERM_000533949 [Tetrahymena thermophila SB210]|eukprot:XP_012655554.1 hypothetical protein TTHERM_000533949 [Tetrahymena thermophila SB210]
MLQSNQVYQMQLFRVKMKILQNTGLINSKSAFLFYSQSQTLYCLQYKFLSQYKNLHIYLQYFSDIQALFYEAQLQVCLIYFEDQKDQSVLSSQRTIHNYPIFLEYPKKLWNSQTFESLANPLYQLLSSMRQIYYQLFFQKQFYKLIHRKNSFILAIMLQEYFLLLSLGEFLQDFFRITYNSTSNYLQSFDRELFYQLINELFNQEYCLKLLQNHQILQSLYYLYLILLLQGNYYPQNGLLFKGQANHHLYQFMNQTSFSDLDSLILHTPYNQFGIITKFMEVMSERLTFFQLSKECAMYQNH